MEWKVSNGSDDFPEPDRTGMTKNWIRGRYTEILFRLSKCDALMNINFLGGYLFNGSDKYIIMGQNPH